MDAFLDQEEKLRDEFYQDMDTFLDANQTERKCPDMEVFQDTCEFIEKRANAESICSNSSSEDDSLGLLADEQLYSDWNEDQEICELSNYFEGFNVQNLTQTTTLNVSPIIGEKSAFPNLSIFESTPKIKETIQTLKYGENMLNKTINIDSLYDGLTKKSNFNLLEYNEPNKDVLNATQCVEEKKSNEIPLNRTFETLNELNKTSLKDVLNITQCVEEEKSNEIPLNRTFETLNELNKTLPLVFNVMETNLNSTKNLEIEKNVQNKTFSKSPKGRNEIIRESENQKMPVVVKHPQIKIKHEESFENSQSVTTHFKQFFEHFPQKSSEQDSSQTGTRKKLYKGDGSERSRTLSLKHTIKKKSKETYAKVTADCVLKNTNRELQSGTALSQNPPFNLSFKKLDKEPKNKQELLDIPTIRLVEEPYTDQIVTRLPQRSSLIGRPQRRSQGQRGPRISGRGGEMPNRIAPPRMPVSSQKPPVLSGRRGELPMRITPIRIPRRTRPPQVEPPLVLQSQRLPLESHQMSSGTRNYSSRIPTLGPRRIGSHSIFDTTNPFQDPPVRGRSVIPKKTRKPPLQ